MDAQSFYTRWWNDELIETMREVTRMSMREFETGATRHTDEGKFDYEGFLSPPVLVAYAAYMHKNRVQADGNLRDSDNWQKGIPQEAYIKSAWRHFMDFWLAWRGNGTVPYTESIPALLFNLQGFLHEELRKEDDRINS